MAQASRQTTVVRPFPGSNFLNRIRYSTKLVTTSVLVVALTVGLLIRVIYEVNQNVEFRQSEMKGATYIRSLHAFMQLVRNHWVQRAKGADADLQVTQQAIAEAIQDLDELELGYGQQFDTTASWRNIKSKWEQILGRQEVGRGESRSASIHAIVIEDLGASPCTSPMCPSSSSIKTWTRIIWRSASPRASLR